MASTPAISTPANPTPFHLPFQGLKVIDAGSFVAGPAAATILGDFGASVIKVEPPEGDPFRFLFPGENFFYEVDARNKKSITLDLKTPAGLQVLYKLVAEADVFVTNTPLEARKRLKVDSDTLLALNPRLVYASLTAYGEEGEDAKKSGFDSTAYWARSGLQHLVKPSPDSAPALSQVAQGDHPTSVSVFAAIVTGLYRRERTGKGGLVRSSLLANGHWANSSQLQGIYQGREIVPRPARHEAVMPFANPYKCSCGRYVTLTILNERQVIPFLNTIGRPDLAQDPRFSTMEAGMLNNFALIQELDQVFATKTRDEWVKILDKAGITFGYVASPEDAAWDRQAMATDVIVPFEDGSGLTISSPIDLAAPKVPARRGPSIGEHSLEVMRSMGYSEKQIADLAKAGAFGPKGIEGVGAGGDSKL